MDVTAFAAEGQLHVPLGGWPMCLVAALRLLISFCVYEARMGKGKQCQAVADI
jgi:hypothetical protein